MSSWFSGLHVFPGMFLVVFGTIYLVAVFIYFSLTRLAVGERTRAFKGISAACLSPLGAIFALMLVFTAEPVWKNTDQARDAVATEAGALRDVLILARSEPAEAETALRGLVGKYVDEAVHKEWPAMVTKTVPLVTHNVCGCSLELLNALDYTRALKPQDEMQRTNERDIVKALEEVRTARRQRILISEEGLSPVKAIGVAIIGLALLTWVGLVHAENRAACKVALAIFATVISTAFLLVLTFANPFNGDYSVKPDILQEIAQDIPAHAS
jgi:hypothetical protein